MSTYVEDDEKVRWLLKRFYLGREGPADAVQDFLFDPSDFALKVRKLLINDVGDPGDMGFGRIGPDNAPWDAERSAFRRLPPGYNIGTWYWRAWCGETDADPFGSFTGKNGQIYVRTVGEQTPRSSGGSLHLASTPIGALEPVDRIVIESSGIIDLSGVPTRWDGAGDDAVGYALVRTSRGLRRIKLE